MAYRVGPHVTLKTKIFFSLIKQNLIFCKLNCSGTIILPARCTSHIYLQYTYRVHSFWVEWTTDKLTYVRAQGQFQSLIGIYIIYTCIAFILFYSLQWI